MTSKKCILMLFILTMSIICSGCNNEKHNENKLDTQISDVGLNVEAPKGPDNKITNTSDYGYRIVKQNINGGWVNLAVINRYDGIEENVVLPESVDGYPVIGVDGSAFNGNASVKSIKADFGKNAMNLEDAFNDMPSLTEISISGPAKILESVNNCPCLNKIQIGDGTAEIFDSFKNLTSLEKIVLPDTLKRVTESSFSACVRLKNTVIPDGTEYISGTSFVNGSLDEKSIIVPGYMGNNIINADKYGYYAYICAGNKKYDINRITGLFTDPEEIEISAGESAEIELQGEFYDSVRFDADEEALLYSEEKSKKAISTESIDAGLFSFESENPDIVWITEKGILTGRHPGSATVTVKFRYGKAIFCTCHVVVI